MIAWQRRPSPGVRRVMRWLGFRPVLVKATDALGVPGVDYKWRRSRPSVR